MKKILLLLIVCFLFSCTKNIKKSDTNFTYNGQDIIILEVDSCEYIMMSNNSNTLTHKGNCKYCKQRLEKLIK